MWGDTVAIAKHRFNCDIISRGFRILSQIAQASSSGPGSVSEFTISSS
jgi:hypothetical protein